MKGDFSRFTHDPQKHYTTILKQQGRVALDADWNEYVEMRDDLERTQSQDVIGVCGVPKSSGGFTIGFKIISPTPELTLPDLTISAGHLYVDGLLCTIEQPITYLTQPDYPAPLALEPGEGRTDLIYLDVWQRHITAIEDPEIREKALGGPDTTTRLKTIWQVKVIKDVGHLSKCNEKIQGWPPTPGGGRLSTRIESGTSVEDPCLITTVSGYRGLENKLYRVEIHDEQIPTFKWSCDNGAIAFPIEFIPGKPKQIKLPVSARDGFQMLSKGDWVEISGDQTELNGGPGLLTQIEESNSTQRTFTLKDDVSAYSQESHPKIRQWNSGATQVTDAWIELEKGIQIRFSGTPLQCGDYWVFTARTANQEIDILAETPPQGITHHYCKLALLTWQMAGEQWQPVVRDCRPDFPPLTDIEAEDVRFNNTQCQLPDTETVQDALDRLCAERDFRHHNKHLHGWGIVCGLQVICHSEREKVTIRKGYAIDCEGNDIYLKDSEDLNLIAQIQQQPALENPLLDQDGNGKVWLTLELDEDYNYCFRVEPYDSAKENFRSLLNGTLFMDFYNTCIQSLVDFVKQEFTVSPEEAKDLVDPAQKRFTTFLNLLWQFVNPENGRYIFLSETEHDILLNFYKGLKDLLQSKTYCAMFDDDRPFPESYPFSDSKLSTIFGKSLLQSNLNPHRRIRIDPTGKIAYTVGADNTIHVYDLGQELMLAELTFPGEEDVKMQDVACSADGKQLYAVATVQDKDTLFAIADIEELNYTWHSMTVVCGLKIVTLATDPLGSRYLYAIGKGKGIFKIDPDNLQEFALHPTPLGESFNAVGHLVIVEAQETAMAFATARQQNSALSDQYDSVRRIKLSGGYPSITFQLQAKDDEGTLQTFSGDDDIALIRGSQRKSDKLYAVVNPLGDQNNKSIFAFYNVTQSDSAQTPRIIDLGLTDEIRMVYNPKTGYLLLSCEESFCIRLMDVQKDALVAEYRHPVQIFPLSLVVSPQKDYVYALNYFSSTISKIPIDRLTPEKQLDLNTLADYRNAILEAFVDLLGEFLQYAKDCFCQRFLVNCPECSAEEKIYLAGISIKKYKVDHICNFSRRRYVKSFPTVAYWLSVIPIMPLLKHGFKTLCCAILPDFFSNVQMQAHETSFTHVSGKQMQSGLQFVKKQDVRSYLKDNAAKIQVNQKLFRDWAKDIVFNPPKEPPKPDVKQRDIINQRLDDVRRRLEQSDIVVKKVETYNPALGRKNLLRFTQAPVNLAPGSQVILCEEQGVVRYYAIAEEPPEAIQEIQTELADQKIAVDSKVSTLQQQVDTQNTLLADLQMSAQKIQAQDQEILNLQTTLQTLQINFENVKATSQQAIKERDQEISNLQTTLQSLQTNFERVEAANQQTLTAQVQEIQTLQKTLETLHTDVKGIEKLREEVDLLKRQRTRGQRKKDEDTR